MFILSEYISTLLQLIYAFGHIYLLIVIKNSINLEIVYLLIDFGNNLVYYDTALKLNTSLLSLTITKAEYFAFLLRHRG